MRDRLVQHVPDPGAEFCLTDEMGFLFRMLATAAQGTVCQVRGLRRIGSGCSAWGEGGAGGAACFATAAHGTRRAAGFEGARGARAWRAGSAWPPLPAARAR